MGSGGASYIFGAFLYGIRWPQNIMSFFSNDIWTGCLRDFSLADVIFGVNRTKFSMFWWWPGRLLI